MKYVAAILVGAVSAGTWTNDLRAPDCVIVPPATAVEAELAKTCTWKACPADAPATDKGTKCKDAATKWADERSSSGAAGTVGVKAWPTKPTVACAAEVAEVKVGDKTTPAVPAVDKNCYWTADEKIKACNEKEIWEGKWTATDVAPKCGWAD